MNEKPIQKSSENETEFIPLSEAAKLVGYTPEYLNLLSRNGKLQAKKIGRNWHTKKKWINEFLATIPNGEGKIIVQIEPKEKKLEKQESILEEAIPVSENKKEKVDLSSLEIKQEFEEPKNDWLKIFAALASVVIVMPLIFAGTYIAKNFVKNYKNNSDLFQLQSQIQNFGSRVINENNQAGKVAAAQTATQNNSNKSGIVLASENYKIDSINLGGGMAVLSNGENLPLKINNIKSESFVDNKKNEVYLVVSWITNKTAISQLSYSKNNGQNSKTAKEDSYGFNHSVVLSGLESGASYVYQVKCTDQWGNSQTSNYFGIYTASKPVSIFDLISNALGETFGWAIKK